MATEVSLVAAADVDFEVYRGDTQATTITLTDGSNNPIDLTGAAILMQLKKSKSSATALYEKKTADNSLTISGTGHNIITVVTWSDVAAGSYQYDLQVTYGNGTVVTYLKGKITVPEDVSR